MIRDAETRLLRKKRLGSFYLADVRTLIEAREQAEARASELERERDEYAAELETRVERLTRERDNASSMVDELEDALRDGAENGETPEIRAWCSLVLFKNEYGLGESDAY